MENMAVISLDEYMLLIDSQKKYDSLREVYFKDYMFVGWDNDGFSIRSKDETMKHLRKTFEDDRQFYSDETDKLKKENDKLKEQLNKPWYKLIFKKI